MPFAVASRQVQTLQTWHRRASIAWTNSGLHLFLMFMFRDLNTPLMVV